MSLPQEIKYSENLRPVSVGGNQASVIFVPNTAGSYTATNNLCRIPLGSSKFLDMRNAVLRMDVTTATGAGFLDGNAASFIQRMSVLSPSNQRLDYIDNFGRVYAGLSDLEVAKEARLGLKSITEGYTQQTGSIVFQNTAASTYTIQYVNNGAATTIATGFGGGAASTYHFGDWTFANTAANVVSITYKGTTVSVDLASATVSPVSVGGVTFSHVAATDDLIINGTACDAAGERCGFPAFPDSVAYSSRCGRFLASGATATFEIPLLNCLSLMKTYLPAFALGGNGITIELQFAANRDALTPLVEASQPTYSIDNVQLIVPSIDMDSQVYSMFNNMLQQAGSVSISSVGHETMVYPVASAPTSVSIPLAFKKRSLKAIFTWFTPNAASAIRTTSGRDSLVITKYQFRSGSQYYPLQPVDNVQTALCETLRAVSKLSDVRNTPVLDQFNYRATAVNGGAQLIGVDFEAAPLSFIESGLNNESSSAQMYLDIQCSGASGAGTFYIVAQFDNTLTILPNRDMVMTS